MIPEATFAGFIFQKRAPASQQHCGVMRLGQVEACTFCLRPSTSFRSSQVQALSGCNASEVEFLGVVRRPSLTLQLEDACRHCGKIRFQLFAGVLRTGSSNTFSFQEVFQCAIGDLNHIWVLQSATVPYCLTTDLTAITNRHRHLPLLHPRRHNPSSQSAQTS